MIEIGSIVAARYRLESKLGEGGMGAVYEAAHTITGRRVAIKLLEKRPDISPDVIERFTLEARASAEIAHENVVEVFDAGQEADGTLYIVMELLEGETLDAIVKRDRVVQPEMLVPIMDELLSVLAAMHERGIVHRDLKPANIFLAQANGKSRLKLLDFGIAKVLGDDSRTRTGMVMGTPAFMAPEQMRNAKAATSRSDLWSVGVILYEALVGHRPFRGETFGLIAQITSGEPAVSLREINPKLPEGLVLLVERLLDKNVENRPPDAESVRIELLPLLEACPPLEACVEPPESAAAHTSVERPRSKRTPVDRAGSPSVSRSTSRTGWRAAFALAVGACIGLVGVAVYASYRLRPPPRSRRVIARAGPTQQALSSNAALDRFIRRWLEAVASPPPPATWVDLYASQVSFRHSASLFSPLQLRRTWADADELSTRFTAVADGARFTEIDADLNAGVSAACINVLGAAGPVFDVRLDATEVAGRGVASMSCRRAEGEYRVLVRNIENELHICQEAWVADRGYCRSCPDAPLCTRTPVGSNPGAERSHR